MNTDDLYEVHADIGNIDGRSDLTATIVTRAPTQQEAEQLLLRIVGPLPKGDLGQLEVRP